MRARSTITPQIISSRRRPPLQHDDDLAGSDAAQIVAQDDCYASDALAVSAVSTKLFCGAVLIKGLQSQQIRC